MLSSQHIAPPFRTSVCEGFPVTSPACLETLFPLAFHAKIIRHREHVAHRVGVNHGLSLVALSGNHPLQRDLAVIHDDVNRWNGLHGITVEARLAENRAIRGDADSIVHRREGQDLDLIIDACYAVNTLHHTFSIALERRPRHLTVQPDGAAVHAVGQIVEYSVVRQHDQLVTNFASNSVLPLASRIGGPVGVLIFVLGITRYQRERHGYYDGTDVHRDTFHKLLPGCNTSALGLPCDIFQASRALRWVTAMTARRWTIPSRYLRSFACSEQEIDRRIKIKRRNEMLGLGLVGTIIVIVLLVWVVRRV